MTGSTTSIRARSSRTSTQLCTRATDERTDQKGTRILARTFFNQLRASGYTPHQVIGIATELLDLVTADLKEGDKPVAVQPTQEQGSEWRQRA